MLHELMPDADVQWHDLDTNSHRENAITFPTGTFIHLLDQHDEHNYGVDSYALIGYVAKRRPHSGKLTPYMVALRADGTWGNCLYLYNPFNPHFVPHAESWRIAAWLQDLPDTLEARRFLQTIGGATYE